MKRYMHRTNRSKNREIAIRAITAMLVDVKDLGGGKVEYNGKRYFVRASVHAKAIKIADDSHPHYADDSRYAETDAMMIFRDMLDGRCTLYIVPTEAAYERMNAGYSLPWEDVREIHTNAYTEHNHNLPKSIH